MGVRIISGAGHFSPVVPTFKGPLGAWRGAPRGGLQGRRAPFPRTTLLFDGTVGKEGLAAALPSNMGWFDPSPMLEQGQTQVSLSAVYSGAGTCKVYGAMLPPDYATKVANSNGADLVTEATAKWALITTLNPNVGANLLVVGGNNIVYTLYQFEFLLATQPGNVVLTSM